MEEVLSRFKEMFQSANFAQHLPAGALIAGPLLRSTIRMVSRSEQLFRDVAITFYANMILRSTKVTMLPKEPCSELSTDV
jgi:hypothetical protein